MRGLSTLVLLVLVLSAAGCARQSYGTTADTPEYTPVSEPVSPPAPSEQQIAARVQAAQSECEAKYTQHKIRKAAGAVSCFEQKLLEISQETSRPLSDTDKLLLAKMYELAEKVDRKQLTKAEAKLQFAEYQMALKERAQARAQIQAAAEARREAAEQQERNIETQTQAIEAAAAAARQQAATRQLLDSAAIFGAMAGPSRLPYGAYQLPNGVVTCNQNGTITTCY